MTLRQIGPKTYLSNMEVLYQIPSSVALQNGDLLIGGFIAQTIDEKLIFCNRSGLLQSQRQIWIFDPYTGLTTQSQTYMQYLWNGTGMDMLSTNTYGPTNGSVVARYLRNLHGGGTQNSGIGLLGDINGTPNYAPVIPWQSSNIPSAQSVVLAGHDEVFANSPLDPGYTRKHININQQTLDTQNPLYFYNASWGDASSAYPPTAAFSKTESGKFSINYSFQKGTISGNPGYTANTDGNGYPFPMCGWGSLKTRSQQWSSYDYGFNYQGVQPWPGYTWNYKNDIALAVNRQWIVEEYDMYSPYLPTTTHTIQWIPPVQSNFQTPTFFPNPLLDFSGDNCHIVYNYDILNNQPFPRSLRINLVSQKNTNTESAGQVFYNLESIPVYKFGGYAVTTCASFWPNANNTQDYNLSLTCSPKNLKVDYLHNGYVGTSCITRVDYENGVRLYLDIDGKSPAGNDFAQPASGYTGLETNGIKYIHIRRDGLIGAVVVDSSQLLWYCVSDPPYFVNASNVSNMVKFF